jgi:nitrite reductase/ring-hydroxylating ferredoxin subunit
MSTVGTRVGRRKFARLAFFGLIGTCAIGGAAAVSQFLGVSRASRKSFVGMMGDFVPGAAPLRFLSDGAAAPSPSFDNKQFWVARLTGTDARVNGDDGVKGFIALAGYCTHLGCAIPWRPDFAFSDDSRNASETGWFRCPCHGPTFTRAGRRVFGPAPRGLDSHPVEIHDDGSVWVDRGRVIPGRVGQPSVASEQR